MIKNANTSIKSILNRIANDNGYVSRGNAYFRVIGDGIFQVLKLEKGKRSVDFEINLALYSMYSFLEPQWFTAHSCLAKYSLMRKMHTSWRTAFGGTISRWECCEQEIESLQEFIVQELNHVLQQEQLIAMMCKLENIQFGHVIWNDLQKFAPYLYVGDYANAEKVICSVMDQNIDAYRDRMIRQGQTQMENVLTKFEIQESKILNELYQMVHERDADVIKKYLNENLQNNLKLARFCYTR